MSFTKQQIIEAANYIAAYLISSEDSKTKKWFCQQFNQAMAMYSLDKKLEFSINSKHFSDLVKSLLTKGITIPEKFQVTLFNNGKVIALDNGVQSIICCTKEPMDERYCFTELKSLMDELDVVQYESEEEGWEVDFKAPPFPTMGHFIESAMKKQVAASSVKPVEQSSSSHTTKP